MEAFYEPIWQEVTTVATAFWRKTEDEWARFHHEWCFKILLRNFQSESFPLTEGLIGRRAECLYAVCLLQRRVSVCSCSSFAWVCILHFLYISQAQHSPWEGWELMSSRNLRVHPSLQPGKKHKIVSAIEPPIWSPFSPGNYFEPWGPFLKVCVITKYLSYIALHGEHYKWKDGIPQVFLVHHLPFSSFQCVACSRCSITIYCVIVWKSVF